MFLSHVLLEQRFHLEGNFLPKGNFGLWKEIWKEIAFGRKYCYKEGNEKEILFYLIISKNKAIFIQFCAKENSENAISNDLETPHFQNFPKRDLTDVGNYVSSTGPQNRYIEITTKPRTQGIISQTLFGGGGGYLAWAGKTLGVSCVCVRRGKMQETVMESLFAPTASSPQLLCFLSPGGEDELILTGKIQSYLL